MNVIEKIEGGHIDFSQFSESQTNFIIGLVKLSYNDALNSEGLSKSFIVPMPKNANINNMKVLLLGSNEKMATRIWEKWNTGALLKDASEGYEFIKVRVSKV